MFQELNSSQNEAVQAPPEAPVLVVAGAGTGKTRTLTCRIAQLISDGVLPGGICAITFTNKAAREMEARINSLLRERFGAKHHIKGMFVGTFHALGASILRKEAKLTGRTSGFVIFDDKDTFQLIKRVYKEKDDGDLPVPSALKEEISALKNGMSSPEGLLGRYSDKETEKILIFFKGYEATLRKYNAFDFDDLIEKPVKILRDRPETLLIYRNRFTHIFVDEYQDINKVQHELVRLLAGDRSPVCAVGDAEQTIYTWRGSDINLFFSFPEYWKNAKIVTLEENYRSTPNILEAASELISHNKYESNIPRATNLTTTKPRSETVKIIGTEEEDEEAYEIAAQITHDLTEFPDQSVGVLYRVNAKSRAIEQALISMGIPYRVFGGLRFYERREVKDVVAAIRLAVNPKDEIARERLEKNLPLKIRKKLSVFFENAKSSDNPVALVNMFLDASGYAARIMRSLTKPLDRIEHIEELLRAASAYKTTQEFLEHVSLFSGERASGGKDAARVTLMTIHLAKGLEFDRVFVLGCEEGLLPHARSLGTDTELQEERRLLYVAMTRAKKSLTLAYAGTPSRFLGEIPETMLETRDVNEDPYEEESVSWEE